MISILLFNTNTWLGGRFHTHTNTHMYTQTKKKDYKEIIKMFTVLLLCSVHGDVTETPSSHFFLYFPDLQYNKYLDYNVKRKDPPPKEMQCNEVF